MKPSADVSSSVKRIFWAFRPWITAQRVRLIGGMIFVLLATFMEVLQPWPLKYIYDHVFGKGTRLPLLPQLQGLDSRTLLGVLSLSFVGISVVGAAAAYVSTVLLSISASNIIAQVRDCLFLHLVRLPLSFHSRHKTGDLITRVTYDTDRLREVLVTAILPFLTTCLTIVAMVGVMFWMNWELALVSVVAFPIFLLTVKRQTARLKQGGREQRLREGAIATTTAEVLSSMPVIQALSLHNVFAEVFSSANQKSSLQGARVQRLSAGLERSVEVFATAGTALALWLGAQMIVAKTITPGDLIVFLTYLRSAFKPMRQLAKYAGQIVRAVASGDRIVDLLETTPDIQDAPGAIEAGRFQGAIRLENVWFRYELETPVLRGINVTIEPGERIAIVGPSGSGKSTLASLLLRLYEPHEGRILFDERDIREYKLESLRRQVGVALQDSMLFAVSVRENIQFGSKDSTDEEVIHASRLANAHEFIDQLPQGYDTIIGERGSTLSGGQRRRVALARAAVRDTPVLILDEPTTGLDGKNESEVNAALRQLSEGRTTILITHDLASVSHVDRILYLHEGEIVEEGTQEELMMLDGHFAAAYRLQISETNRITGLYAEA
ncbi:MAG TPA: ABC transporter ATP-binding protein [Bryobacteraceae bacterium]|nr:ABC transporter ATP-binding protein [Bryobacteraceae bacterium]